MTRAELIWYFSTIRWIPLFLLTTIGVTDLLMPPFPSKPEHWLFFLTAIVLGVLLFRLGGFLMTCNQGRRR